MATVALTGGGTGGHIVPALALIPYLHEYFDRIIFIGSYGELDRRIVSAAKIPFFPVKNAPFSRTNILENFKIPFALAAGISEAKEIFKSERPDVLFVKGGYCSLPAAYAAKSLGIPVVVHESDMTMGLANRVASNFAARVIGSFPETKGVDVIIGTPLREEIFKGDAERARKTFALRNLPVVSVVGGSQGSEALNRAVWNSLRELTKKYDVIHVSGKGFDPERRITGYHQIEYTDAIADVFAVSDAVVSRAGANTLAELAALGKRTLAVPLPKGVSRGDQEDNAESYRKRGLVEVLPQAELSGETLASRLELLLASPSPRPSGGRENAKLIVDEIISAVSHKKR